MCLSYTTLKNRNLRTKPVAIVGLCKKLLPNSKSSGTHTSTVSNRKSLLGRPNRYLYHCNAQYPKITIIVEQWTWFWFSRMWSYLEFFYHTKTQHTTFANPNRQNLDKYFFISKYIVLCIWGEGIRWKKMPNAISRIPYLNLWCLHKVVY